jgi:hypothetical protein
LVSFQLYSLLVGAECVPAVIQVQAVSETLDPALVVVVVKKLASLGSLDVDQWDFLSHLS